MYGKGMERTPDEKRAYTRYNIWFPVTLEVAEGEVWCICRDASPAGLLVSSKVALEVGGSVVAVFRIAATEEMWRIKGRVARSSQSDPAIVLAFPIALAIEFEGPLPELEPGLIRRSERPPRP
jgi:hypothetical protein